MVITSCEKILIREGENMIIKNCKIIYWDRIEEGSLLIEEGKIKRN